MLPLLKAIELTLYCRLKPAALWMETVGEDTPSTVAGRQRHQQ